MRYRVTFEGRRAVLPDGKLFLGVTGDNLIDAVAFSAPVYAGAAAYVKLRAPGAAYGTMSEYKDALIYDAETGDWVLTVTRAILALGAKIELQIQLEAPVDGAEDVRVWQCVPFPAYISDTINADAAVPAQQLPYLQALDLRVQEAAARAENASRGQPYIGANGHWYAWDADLGEFRDTGVSATGPQGPATISIGTTTAGAPAAVTNSGDSAHAVLNFTLPAATGAGVSLADAGGYFPTKNVEAATQQLAGVQNFRKVTGNPAHFYPVPASSLALKAFLTAVQAGSGDPSPTNIRAISPAVAAGGTVKATRTGKNLFDGNEMAKVANYVDNMFATYSNGVLTVVNSTGVMRYPQYRITLPPGTYTLSTDGYVTAGMVYAQPLGDGDYSSAALTTSVRAKSFTLTTRTTFRIMYSVPANTTVSASIQLEAGDGATPYEPYAGADYTLTAQQAKYGLPGAEAWMANDGGEGDPTAFLSLTGGEAWAKSSLVVPGYSSFYTNTNGASGNDYPIICSHFPTRKYADWTNLVADAFIETAGGGSIGIRLPTSVIGADTLAAFTAWLAAQVTAGTPVQVVYKRATPATATGTAVSMAALTAVDKYSERMNVVTLDKGIAEVGFAEHPNRDFARLTEKTGYGVVSGLGVTAQATPNMTVKVAPGIVYTPAGDRFNLLGAAALAVSAADATNPRIDIVYVSAAGIITYLAGTAAATPTAPALPTGGVLLAEIAVAAGATSIGAANITARKKSILSEDYIVATLLGGLTGWIRYSKSATGHVTVRFSITPGSTLAAATYLAQLFTGYRPGMTQGFQLRNGSTGAVANAYITTGGAVYNTDSLTSGVLYTGSITYLAEA